MAETLKVATEEEEAMRKKWRKGDGVPAGLFAFGATTFVLSCYTAGVPNLRRPPTDPVNLITGMALFHGGLLQILVGIGEIFRHNTLSATIFTSYGAFWLSYAAILIPSFGISAAYHDPRVFGNAVGVFLLGWTVWTLLLTIASLRSPRGIFLLFLSALLTFVLLAASSFVGAARCVALHRLAGLSGILTSICAFCNAFDSLLARMDPFPCCLRRTTSEPKPTSPQTQDEESAVDGGAGRSSSWSPV